MAGHDRAHVCRSQAHDVLSVVPPCAAVCSPAVATPDERAQRQRDDVAATVRAAWAYSGLSYRELAERAGVPYDALRKWAGHTGPRRGRVPDDALERIADACGVPRWFMDAGWEGAWPAENLIRAWTDGRLEEEVKALYAAALRRHIEHDHPELMARLQILEAMDSLDPAESAAMRELLRYLFDQR